MSEPASTQQEYEEVSVATKVCPKCGQVFPDIGEHWNKYRTKCRTCQIKLEEHRRNKDGYEVRTKALRYLCKSIQGGYQLAGSEDVLQGIYQEFDGAAGVAKAMRQLYDHPKTNSRDRITILKTIITMADKVSGRRTEKEMALMTDEELRQIIINTFDVVPELTDENDRHPPDADQTVASHHEH